MSDSKPHPIADRLATFHEVARNLKSLERRGWARRGVPDAESVADHSFGVTILALLASRELGLSVERTLITAIIHEVCEAIVGDIIPADGVDPVEKSRREEEAAAKILGSVDASGELLSLWQDFEHGRTPEGRLVKELDRLEMAMQAGAYQRQSGLDLSEFIASARSSLRTPELVAVLTDLDAPGRITGPGPHPGDWCRSR